MNVQRWWVNGILTKELHDDVEVKNNIGKTPDELGIRLHKPAFRKQTSKPTQPIEFKEWPLWAKALKQFSKPEDKGIGDVVARMIGDEKSLAFKTWHLATFGKPCNCNGRQARWNRLYPLP